MAHPNLEKFKTICSRIGMNIPTGNRWSWDDKHHHALVVFDKEDLELILLPIALEFDQNWDFQTIEGSSRLINDFIHSGFGLMPGQNLFVASDDQGSGMLLYAACWPWGDGANFSLRVGLFSDDPDYPAPPLTKSLLTEWFHIEPV
jgi:hypothetical protein